MSRITMLDLAKRRNGAKEVGLIEANLSSAPELKYFPARTITGTSFHTLLRTGLPGAAYTGLNEGVPATKSTFESRLVECFPIRSRIEIDKAAVNADDSATSLQADEAAGVMEAVMRLIGRQIYYGRNSGKGDSRGHFGLQDFVDNSMLYNATGTAANTGSSVYFVKFGVKDVQLVFGKNSVLALPPFREESILDTNGNSYDGWVSHLTGWQGLQCTNPTSVVRVCNLTAEAGKGLTDAILARALDLFPTGVTPDAIFMSKRSRTQLREDRSAKMALRGDGRAGSVGGSNANAPTPTDFEDIPIIATDSILNIEAIVS